MVLTQGWTNKLIDYIRELINRAPVKCEVKARKFKREFLSYQDRKVLSNKMQSVEIAKENINSTML